jgi:pimeloyl-[acyl-carrier protein] methyl ester esterase
MDTTTTKLLLLPGLDGTEIFFAPLLRHLPPWIDPHIVQYPGSGANDYGRLLDLVREQMAGWDRFAVLGWSFGGPLALMVASQFPAQVSSVTLCGTFVTPPQPRLVPLKFLVTTPVVATVRALRRTRLLLPGRATPELRRAKAVSWRRVNACVLAARSRAVLGVDARPQLRECRARLMYLVSSRDEVVGRASLAEVLAIAPQTQVAEIEGRHLALFTNPAQSAAHIVRFLQEQ